MPPGTLVVGSRATSQPANPRRTRALHVIRMALPCSLRLPCALHSASVSAHPACPPPPLPLCLQVPSGTPVVNALAKQRAMLENVFRACVGLPPENNMVRAESSGGPAKGGNARGSCSCSCHSCREEAHQSCSGWVCIICLSTCPPPPADAGVQVLSCTSAPSCLADSRAWGAALCAPAPGRAAAGTPSLASPWLC